MATRLSVCLNAGQRKGQAQAALVLAPPHTTEALLQAAANKLRLKKKDTVRARLFVWKSGIEVCCCMTRKPIPSTAPSSDAASAPDAYASCRATKAAASWCATTT